MSIINLPSFVSSVKDINSKNLSSLLELEDPLDYLRELYIQNKELFFDVGDELRLRGIAISVDAPNALLPYDVIEGSHLLPQTSGNQFTKINFELLGLTYFTDRFQVTDDTFFNYIPLEGFRQLNKALDPKVIFDVFEEAGFCVRENNLGLIKIGENAEDISDEKSEQRQSQTDNRLITDVFSDSKYLSFLRYCSQQDLTVISDIQQKNIEEFRHHYGVGVKKHNDFLEKWELVKQEKGNEASSESMDAKEDTYGFRYLTSVDEVFKANTYIAFLRYCKEHLVQYVTDLQPSMVNDFGKAKGIGRKKVEAVEERIEQLLGEEASKAETLSQPISSFPIYNVIEKMSIGELVAFLGISSRITLSDIDTSTSVQDIDNLPSEVRHPIVEEIMNLLPIEKITQELKETVSERDLQVLLLRTDPTETLETIGNKIGVTRERARQIITKSWRKMLFRAEAMNLGQTLLLMKGDRFGLAEEKLRKMLPEGDFFLFTMLREMQAPFCYLSKIKLYVTEAEESLFTKLLNQLEALPEVLSVDELQTAIKGILENQVNEEDQEELQEYLLRYSDRKKYGTYISRSSIPIVKRLEILFRYHLDEPILLDELGMDLLNRLSKEVFGSTLTVTSLRALQARVRDVEDVILVDNLTFQWLDESVLEEEIFEDIEVFMNEQLKDRPHINSEDVYRAFEERLEEHGIHNKIHLYSLIKYLFENQYTIGKGNTLNIYKKGVVLSSLEGKLDATLLNATKDYTIAELAENLNYRASTISLMVSRSPKYLNWDNDLVKLTSSLGITEEEVTHLSSFIALHMTNGYSTTFKLFQECQFDNEMSAFLQKYNIQTDYVLGNVIKTMIPSIKGHTVFLFNENSSVQTIEEAVIQKFTHQTTRTEITKFVLDYGYSTAAAHQILHSLMKKNEYVMIDSDQLYNRGNLEIGDEVKEAVYAYLQRELDGKEYLVLSELIGYRRKLPNITYRWTPRLLHTIAVELGFRHIKTVDDYRYDKLVIVGANSSFQAFDEIVYKELTSEYDGAMHEIEIAKYFKGKGLLWSDERLPFELLNSNFFSIDEFGRVKLTGDDN